MNHFDPTAAIASGITVLEASAGTGKTHAIADLVTRFVCEGVRLQRILVVTFTRMATAELRDRVRRRLVEAADYLEARVAGHPLATDDAVLRWLTEDPAAVQGRRDAVAAALTEFDAATIATIHGFCQQMLAGIGLAADVDPGVSFVEDMDELVTEIIEEVVLRRFAAGGPFLEPGKVAELARAVARNPDAAIIAGPGDGPALRAAVAREVRAQVDRRKRDAGVVSYDDLLTRLAEALRDPAQGPLTRRRLQARFDVALVDEFQDTDPVQWEIVSSAFGGDGKTLILIGDPKQAIYAFRGADVHAYLAAKQAAGDQQSTLATNWRSDGSLLTAFNELFRGATLGDEQIRYYDVAPAAAHVSTRLHAAAVAAPLRVRVVRRDVGIELTPGRYVQADAARDHIARDVAVQVVELLASGATLTERDRAGNETAVRPIAPPDVAVLVRTNAQAAQVQSALLEAGVPAVIGGVGSVFKTPAAPEWLRLLEALEQPSSRTRTRAAALTAFVGWSSADVATADDARWDQLQEQVHQWADLLRSSGVAAVERAIVASQDVPRRLLSTPDGERRLVDLEHIGELLHAQATAEESGPTALTGWLRDQMRDTGDDTIPDARSRRLESDAEAVQVLTVHRAKGLEFPVVFVPFMYARSESTDPVPVVHDDATAGRVVDVSGEGPDFEERQKVAKGEGRGEELRLLYVALTRARHQVVVWWAPAVGAGNAPLTRVLLCRRKSGEVLNVPDVWVNHADDVVQERLEELAERSNGLMSVEPSPVHVALPRWQPPQRQDVDLRAAVFGREVDHRWVRTSYSALTSAAHEANYSGGLRPLVSSEPDEAPKDDEWDDEWDDEGDDEAPDATSAQPRQTPDAEPVPLAAMPGGTEVGTFVHAVLEQVDFTADDLEAELAGLVAQQAIERNLHIDTEAVARGLALAVATPLGPLAGDRRLAGIGPGDRLNELAFELPVAVEVGDVTVDAVADLFRRHVTTGPLARYGALLQGPTFHRAFRGYLAGSIDAVLRIGGRYLVVDYKTNWLGDAAGGALTSWHYRPEAVATAMMRGHYPLQALLYAVALHRYLRWRVRGYDPAEQLGGVLYLFVRGMTGPEVPRAGGQPHGVFAWRPPDALVLGASDLLDRGRVTS